MPEQITLADVVKGRAGMRDLRITPEALEHQAAVAERAGRRQLGENLRRAAELVNVPDDLILAVYNALRPGRATTAELEQIAQRLETEYAATRCAALVREAASATHLR